MSHHKDTHTVIIVLLVLLIVLQGYQMYQSYQHESQNKKETYKGGAGSACSVGSDCASKRCDKGQCA